MYRGIYNLRSADDNIILTAEQLEESIKCSKDPVYFFRNYCYIHNARQGLHLFQPRPRQLAEIPVLSSEKMVKSDWYRQSGYTTLVLALMLWKAMFTANTACLYMIPKKELAYENFNEKVRQMYLALPEWLQTGVKEWTHERIRLANGSIFCAKAASADNAAGIGWDYIFIDEFGWIKDKAMMEIVNRLFPVAWSSKKQHLILGQSHRFGRQTPANLLFWQNNTLPFHVSEFTWDQDERLDAKWAEAERLRIGDRNFEKQYCGKIEMKDDPDGLPEQFGRWTVWAEGKFPDVKERSGGRYICTVAMFSRSTGLPVGTPHIDVLAADGNGVFHGLFSDDGTYEKVVAWMPAPEIPGEVREIYGE